METRFSEQLQRHAGATWPRAVDHRLFHEIITDTVDDAHFERYLRIEFAFIDTAAVALGAAVRLAPDMGDRTRLAVGLYELLTSQVAFFEDALGDDRHTIRPPQAEMLHSSYQQVSMEGSYEQLLAAMLAAEWLYRTWCAATIEQPSSRPVIQAWTKLHTDPVFVGHARWLMERLDALGPGLSEHERALVAEVFVRVLEAEISFHDAVYDRDEEGSRP